MIDADVPQQASDDLGAENKPADTEISSTVTAALPKAAPVEATERVASVDVIRGVALLGILAMNIVDFAWPGQVYSIPIMDPEAGPVDTTIWAFNHLVFDTKMMTLFSMLFGAGLVLMSDRSERRGARMRGVYYRRVAWLLVIGLIHAYLIWDGDILVMYALCGFLLYPFRKLRPRTLIITGTLFSLIFVPLLLGFRFGGVPYMRETAGRVEAEIKQGKRPHWWDEKVRDGWKAMSKSEMPKREDFLKAIALHRGPYPELVKHRAGQLIFAQTLGFVLGGWWLAGGRMLIGMGLMKLGVFSAERSRRFYLLMMVLGYGLGLPLMVFDSAHQITHGFFLGHQIWYLLDGWPFLTLYGSIPVVFGHIGAVMLICKSGALTWLTRRLAAAGRMALSNYLLDSVVCTTLFYGYGFDLFGAIHRPMLYAIVISLWVVQLLVSTMWLDVFRFGPAEWVWRSLTYWKPQPIWAKRLPTELVLT
ncbi:MAG: hypothetical protein JWN86_53 [Planctomycetota bacterium]|nr:hypothetical protein [Planctomycetota bacterium]